MNPNIPFEIALQFLAIVYVASAMLLLAVSEVCLAVIEAVEESDN